MNLLVLDKNELKVKSSDNVEEQIARLCNIYIGTVCDTFSNIVPKLCMNSIIYRIKDIEKIIGENFQNYNYNKLSELLIEPNDIGIKRKQIENQYTKIKTAKNAINNISL